MSAPDSSRLACTKCGVAILPETAERNGGKCAPCAARKRFALFRDLPGHVLAIVAWPFVAIVFLAVRLWKQVAAVVPGTKANLYSRLKEGWIPNWSTVQNVWMVAPCFYPGLIGPDARITLEFALLETLTNDESISSTVIAGAVDEDLPMLSAYCIEVLQRRGETEIVSSLPVEALEASATVDRQVGCFVSKGKGDPGP